MKHVYTILCVLLFTAFVTAQQINTISTRCPSPNRTVYASVTAGSLGNITHTPCPSGSSIFTGTVDFSGATVVGVVNGTGTTNFIPRWTNGAAKVIGNTPFSWDGSVYNFQNTALNNTFLLSFTPLSNNGSFTVGRAGVSTYFRMVENTGNVTLSANNDLIVNGNNSVAINSPNAFIGQGGSLGTFNSSGITLDSDNVVAGLGNAKGRFEDGNNRVLLGDTDNAGGATKIIIDDANGAITASAGNDDFLTIDSSSHTVTLTGRDQTVISNGTGQLLIDSANSTIALEGTGASPRVYLDHATNNLALEATNQIDVTGTNALNLNGGAINLAALTGGLALSSTGDINFSTAGGTVNFPQTVNLSGDLNLSRTITASGTTGNRTINTMAGTVNFAAGAGTVGIVVTNVNATPSSLIFAIARTPDATCSVKSVQPTVGSFVIRMNANCTAETSVAFWVTN